MFVDLSHHLPATWTPLCRRLDALWHWLRRTPIELRLVRAVRRGQVARLVALLEDGQWPLDRALTPACFDWDEPEVRRGRRQGGITLLHEAVRSGRLEVAEALLERGAPVEACTNWGITPALMAAACGDAAMLGLLAHWDADLDRRLPSMSTYVDDYVGPTVLELIGEQACPAYRGDEYARARAARLDSRMAEAEATDLRGRRL